MSWSARISTSSSVESRVVSLHTPTSASLEFWEQHQEDRVLFNVGLVSQDSEAQNPVPINALDLAANSEWFRCLVKHLPVLCGTDLGSVTVPCSVSRHVLEQGIVRAIYGSSVQLDSSNVEAIYRAADAMQVRSVVHNNSPHLLHRYSMLPVVSALLPVICRIITGIQGKLAF